MTTQEFLKKLLESVIMLKPLDILFTGGSGMLGTEMKKHFPKSLFPTHKELDITNYANIHNYISSINAKLDLIVHMAAATNCVKIESEASSTINAMCSNIIGTCNIVQFCMIHNIKLIYISTDYVYKGDTGNYTEEDGMYPINKYGWSKLGGECAVHMYKNSLIIRTSIGPNEFKYEKAFNDQYTSRMVVSKFANILSDIIDKNDLLGEINIGEERKTVYEYAKTTSNKNILPCSRLDIKNYPIPYDTSLKHNHVRS